jgi:hypothetical protein
VLNAEFDVRYFPVDAARVHSRAYSTRIAELKNPDRPDEGEKPVGKDRGFLWRLHTYWRFQEKDGGVYIQLESIGLSRGVPVLLRWLINPIIKRIRRGSLFRLMKSTRTALTNKSAAAAKLSPQHNQTDRLEMDSSPPPSSTAPVDTGLSVRQLVPLHTTPASNLSSAAWTSWSSACALTCLRAGPTR